MIPNPFVSSPFRARRAAGTLALAVLIAVSAGCGGASGPGKDATAQAAIPVEVAPASHQAVTANYSGTATLEAVGEAQVVAKTSGIRSEEHTSELQSRRDLVCRLLLEKKNIARQWCHVK